MNGRHTGFFKPIEFSRPSTPTLHPTTSIATPNLYPHPSTPFATPNLHPTTAPVQSVTPFTTQFKPR